MIPFGNEHVTLIQRLEIIINGKTDVRYARHILSGCSWKMKSDWRLVGTEMQRVTEVVCKIPPGQVTPSPGDYLFRGYMQEVIDSPHSLNKAINAHRVNGAMRVASISNNALASLPLPHIAARGDAV